MDLFRKTPHHEHSQWVDLSEDPEGTVFQGPLGRDQKSNFRLLLNYVITGRGSPPLTGKKRARAQI